MSRFSLVMALICTVKIAASSTLDGKATQKWSAVGIGDVEVTVGIPGGSTLQTTRTDADGKYSIGDLPAGRRVEVKYLRDGYQEKPTLHYVTLADGKNFDEVSMSPEDGDSSQFREYGAMLFKRDQAALIDTEAHAMYAHLPADKRTAVAEGWASLAAAGKGEDERKMLTAYFLDELESASKNESRHRAQEHLNALAVEVGELAYTHRDSGGALVISVPTFYKPEQTNLPNSVQRQYDLLATKLKGFPEYDILIEGHTDGTGSPSLNLGIADKRANIVKEHLVSSGLQPDKVRTVSYGEVPPHAFDTTRRVDIIIVPHVAIPGEH
jgi:OmpA-OmpF porin, OOP family